MTRNEQALPVEQADRELFIAIFRIHPANFRCYINSTNGVVHTVRHAEVLAGDHDTLREMQLLARHRLAHTRPAVSDGAGEVAHNLGVIAPGDTWLDKDAQYYTSTIDVGGHYSRIYCFGSGEAGANQLRDIVIEALSQPASGGVARGAVVSAEYHLSEGLDAALPSDERGWLLRSRFEAARDLLLAALAAPGQDEGVGS